MDADDVTIHLVGNSGTGIVWSPPAGARPNWFRNGKIYGGDYAGGATIGATGTGRIDIWDTHIATHLPVVNVCLSSGDDWAYFWHCFLESDTYSTISNVNVCDFEDCYIAADNPTTCPTAIGPLTTFNYCMFETPDPVASGLINLTSHMTQCRFSATLPIGATRVENLVFTNKVTIGSTNVIKVITDWSLYDGGSDYTPGNVLTADGGNGDATFLVSFVDEYGSITGISIISGGTGYSANQDYNLTGGSAGQNEQAILQVNNVSGGGTLYVDGNFSVNGSLSAPNSVIGGVALTNGNIYGSANQLTNFPASLATTSYAFTQAQSANATNSSMLGGISAASYTTNNGTYANMTVGIAALATTASSAGSATFAVSALTATNCVNCTNVLIAAGSNISVTTNPSGNVITYTIASTASGGLSAIATNSSLTTTNLTVKLAGVIGGVTLTNGTINAGTNSAPHTFVDFVPTFDTVYTNGNARVVVDYSVNINAANGDAEMFTMQWPPSGGSTNYSGGLEQDSGNGNCNMSATVHIQPGWCYKFHDNSSGGSVSWAQGTAGGLSMTLYRAYIE